MVADVVTDTPVLAFLEDVLNIALPPVWLLATCAAVCAASTVKDAFSVLHTSTTNSPESLVTVSDGAVLVPVATPSCPEVTGVV